MFKDSSSELVRCFSSELDKRSSSELGNHFSSELVKGYRSELGKRRSPELVKNSSLEVSNGSVENKVTFTDQSKWKLQV
jgi:hypothetical protein